MITFHVQPMGDPGDPVNIDCPACHGKQVEATPFQSTDHVKLAYIIPLMKLRSTWITCGQCNVQIACTAPLDQLAGNDASALAPLFRYRATGGAKGIALLAFVLSWIPVIGLILASVASFMARGTHGWARGLNVLSIIIAVAATILGGLMLIPI